MGSDVQAQTEDAVDPAVLGLVISVLAEKFPAVRFEADTPDNGIADSQVILDIILTVEESGMVFSPESFDFDGPLSPRKLAQAFKKAL
jgi:hypothetical protein